ncbi:hypothetical protein [Kitasatospora sp. NPDC008115]|uniref:hypothetical protein n=1 Tax=Kitasatospora sp. NPDC008115 TaxID=3364022 RepID=UPI0036E093E9
MSRPAVPVLSRITKVPVDTGMLENAGHYPLEDPGLQQMEDAIADFVTKHTARPCRPGHRPHPVGG